MKKQLITLAVLSSFISSVAIAEESPVTTQPQPNKSGFIEQSDNALAEDMKLDAKIKKLDKQAQIMEKENAIAKMAPGINGKSYGMPFVKAVEGIDRKYSALITFGNGVEYESVTGDILPNGMRVTRVAPGDVRVGSGRKEYRLGFINPYQTLPLDMNSSNGVPGLPR